MAELIIIIRGGMGGLCAGCYGQMNGNKTQHSPSIGSAAGGITERAPAAKIH